MKCNARTNLTDILVSVLLLFKLRTSCVVLALNWINNLTACLISYSAVISQKKSSVGHDFSGEPQREFNMALIIHDLTQTSYTENKGNQADWSTINKPDKNH